jgi:hypothetical protein|tara:strand:+ start:425 stop:703 length:279 start_codon:yes stop_codon:yes gene_type:complete
VTSTEVPTHDWVTLTKLAENLTDENVIVGECAGLSAVFSVEPSSLLRGWLRITTEHGHLYATGKDEFEVLDHAHYTAWAGEEPKLIAVDYNA